MSHTAVHQSLITGVNAQFLESAVQLAAEDCQGTVEHDAEAANYVGGQREKCDIVIKTNTVKHGVGIRVGKGGNVSFVGDSYVRGWNEIKDLVTKHYSVLAIRAAAAEMGASVASMTEVGRSVELNLEVA